MFTLFFLSLEINLYSLIYTHTHTHCRYGGEECASENHTHHDGLEDSVYWQTRLQAEYYTELRALNVFVNQPDYFFYLGGQKTGMGYNENEYSYVLFFFYFVLCAHL